MQPKSINISDPGRPNPGPNLGTEPPKEPSSQAADSPGYFSYLPEFIQQIVIAIKPLKADPEYQLCKTAALKLLGAADKAGPDEDPAVARLKADFEYMNDEIHQFFLEKDRDASFHQMRYRRYQLTYMLLALTATIIGSIQALALQDVINNGAVPIYAFLETIVALVATYVAQLASRQPPYPLWIENRRRAEQLRQEYYRYLLDAYPYTDLDKATREQLLSLRAAQICAGKHPDTKLPTRQPGA